MSQPYLCPKCQTNRTRFAIVDQTPLYVKLDPTSGEIIQQYQDEPDLLHIPYKGSARRVQCGTCGLIEDEQSFIATAQRLKFGGATAQPQAAVNPNGQFTQSHGQPQAAAQPYNNFAKPNQGFSSPQAVSGTDIQQVRQQNAQSQAAAQPYNNFANPNQGFSSPQAAVNPNGQFTQSHGQPQAAVNPNGQFTQSHSQPQAAVNPNGQFTQSHIQPQAAVNPNGQFTQSYGQPQAAVNPLQSFQIDDSSDEEIIQVVEMLNRGNQMSNSQAPSQPQEHPMRHLWAQFSKN